MEAPGSRPVIDRSGYSIASGRSGKSGGRDLVPLPFRGKGGTPSSLPTSGANNQTRVEEVKKVIQGLDPKGRKEIKDYLMLLETQTTNRTDYDRQLEIWNASCGKFLIMVLPGAHIHIAKSSKLAEASRASHQQALAFLDAAGFTGINMLERKGMYDLLAKLLADRAKHIAAKTTAPLSLLLLFQQTKDLAGLFESNFPGYLASGLAGRVLDQISSRITRT